MLVAIPALFFLSGLLVYLFLFSYCISFTSLIVFAFFCRLVISASLLWQTCIFFMLKLWYKWDICLSYLSGTCAVMINGYELIKSQPMLRILYVYIVYKRHNLCKYCFSFVHSLQNWLFIPSCKTMISNRKKILFS